MAAADSQHSPDTRLGAHTRQRASRQSSPSVYLHRFIVRSSSALLPFHRSNDPASRVLHRSFLNTSASPLHHHLFSFCVSSSYLSAFSVGSSCFLWHSLWRKASRWRHCALPPEQPAQPSSSPRRRRSSSSSPSHRRRRSASRPPSSRIRSPCGSPTPLRIRTSGQHPPLRPVRDPAQRSSLLLVL
jgi:hypothetical protein